MVYNETVEAFEKGDDNLFPKSSEKKGFHVRPKAANSEDTFEFTNGLQITKRTFWANRETINELIQLKNIDKTNANKKIKEEIEKSQEQNTKLAELGYNTITRDATSDTYKIENTKEFFLGDKGYLYIIYPYGNKEYTSEMDIVIIK